MSYFYCSRVEVRLSDLAPGDEAEIVRFSNLSSKWCYRLQSLGIYPGGRLQVKKIVPEYLVRAGNTLIAINYGVAKRVEVCKLTEYFKFKSL